MDATIEGKDLVIRIRLEEPPYRASSSGKTLIAATTHGNLVTSLTLQGKPLTISLNAYLPTH